MNWPIFVTNILQAGKSIFYRAPFYLTQDQRLSVLYAAVDSLKEKQNEWTEEERDFQVENLFKIGTYQGTATMHFGVCRFGED